METIPSTKASQKERKQCQYYECFTGGSWFPSNKYCRVNNDEKEGKANSEVETKSSLQPI